VPDNDKLLKAQKTKQLDIPFISEQLLQAVPDTVDTDDVPEAAAAVNAFYARSYFNEQQSPLLHWLFGDTLVIDTLPEALNLRMALDTPVRIITRDGYNVYADERAVRKIDIVEIDDYDTDTDDDDDDPEPVYFQRRVDNSSSSNDSSKNNTGKNNKGKNNRGKGKAKGKASSRGSGNSSKKQKA
jgi:hypothetical protein